MQNHIIDPTFFYDAIEMYSFNYDWYVTKGLSLDDMGRRVTQFEKLSIRGSLQSQGTSLNFRKEGNTESMRYEFYCKSLYRINIGDFIHYKDRWLHVDSVRDFDEYGVRQCTMTMVNLNNYHDLNEYYKYLQGEKIV